MWAVAARTATQHHPKPPLLSLDSSSSNRSRPDASWDKLSHGWCAHAGKCREGYEGTHCDIPFREEGVNDKVSFPDYLCHKNNVFSEILVNISGQCTGNAGILFNRNESVVLSVKLTDGLNYSCEPPCPFCSVFQTIFAVDADNQYGSMSGWCASPIEYHNEDSFAGHFTVDAPDITLWLQRQPMGNYYFGLHMFDTEYCADAGFDANFNASKFTPPTFGKALWKVTKAF